MKPSCAQTAGGSPDRLIPSSPEKTAAPKGGWRWFALGIAVALVFSNHLRILTTGGYVLSAIGVYQYHQNPVYRWVLRRAWQALPQVPPTEPAIIDASEFTKEKFWEVSDNLRKPVVIRGGLAGSKAVNEWNSEFFMRNYPDLHVVVRQMIDDSSFRLVNATMQEFWEAFDRGSRVSIVASSGIFVKYPELLEHVLPEFEDEIVDREGAGVFVNQLFVTPAGRSFYHTEFGGNLFRQISGSKKWTLISPEYNPYLCPYFIRGSGTVKPCVQDFDAPLRDEWFERLPRMEVVLEPGDILFNAPWWWHDVRAVGTDKQQASVAGRIASRKASFQVAPFMTLGVAADYFVRSITESFIYPDNTQEAAAQLEGILIHSWTTTCVKQGRTDCFRLV